MILRVFFVCRCCFIPRYSTLFDRTYTHRSATMSRRIRARTRRRRQSLVVLCTVQRRSRHTSPAHATHVAACRCRTHRTARFAAARAARRILALYDEFAVWQLSRARFRRVELDTHAGTVLVRRVVVDGHGFAFCRKSIGSVVPHDVYAHTTTMQSTRCWSNQVFLLISISILYLLCLFKSNCFSCVCVMIKCGE